MCFPGTVSSTGLASFFFTQPLTSINLPPVPRRLIGGNKLHIEGFSVINQLYNFTA
jgi:hypothetical protein